MNSFQISISSSDGLRPCSKAHWRISSSVPPFFTRADEIFVSDAEKAHAAPVETFSELRHVIRRQLASGMRPDLVEHAPEINQPANFLGRAARGKCFRGHVRKLRRVLALVHSRSSVGCSCGMDRIAGIETEYGCLVSGDAAHPNGDAWPVRVKNHLFRKMRVGRDRPALSRLRRAARQRRFSAQWRPALPRHGAHRVCLAGVPAIARCRGLRPGGRPAPAVGARSARRGGRASPSSRTTSITTPARPSAATRII